MRAVIATASARTFATAPLVTQQCRAERAPRDCARASAAPRWGLLVYAAGYSDWLALMAPDLRV